MSGSKDVKLRDTTYLFNGMIIDKPYETKWGEYLVKTVYELMSMYCSNVVDGSAIRAKEITEDEYDKHVKPDRYLQRVRTKDGKLQWVEKKFGRYIEIPNRIDPTLPHKVRVSDVYQYDAESLADALAFRIEYHKLNDGTKDANFTNGKSFVAIITNRKLYRFIKGIDQLMLDAARYVSKQLSTRVFFMFSEGSNKGNNYIKYFTYGQIKYESRGRDAQEETQKKYGLNINDILDRMMYNNDVYYAMQDLESVEKKMMEWNKYYVTPIDGELVPLIIGDNNNNININRKALKHALDNIRIDEKQIESDYEQWKKVATEEDSVDKMPTLEEYKITVLEQYKDAFAQNVDYARSLAIERQRIKYLVSLEPECQITYSLIERC